MKRLRLSDQETIESKYFRKIFQFQKTSNWCLPQEAYQAQKFEIPELQDLKHQLNHVKGKLSQFDLSKWSLHTRNRDIAGFVMGTLRKKIKPELLTQAWCKFYEVVSTFPLIPPNEEKMFTSLHLCEAPGAFICALNHYLAINYQDMTWKWTANTLNPDYEGNTCYDMIPDDRLICYTQDRWQFGIDLTGDIQKYYNHCDIVTKILMEDKVCLVTADGSIDCMSDPGEQERLVEFLQYCETMTSLAVLKKGGSMVLKIFTIFEESTICLMYLLNCIFNQVSVFKPCTSKSGNSELYVIGSGFHGDEVLGILWNSLIEPYKTGCFKKNTSMFSLDEIPYSFRIQLISCCSDFFLEKQINVIEENIYYFLYPEPSSHAPLQKLKIDVASLYMKKYKLESIPQYRKIVPYLNVHDRKNNVDVFNGYQKPNLIQTFSFNYSCDKYVSIKYGKQINIVNNSRFVSKECLHNFKEHFKKREYMTSLYSLALKHITKNCVVVNGNKYDLIPHYKYQKKLFLDLFSAIQESKHIVFINVPFHTYFLAALWCILASAFDSVYYSNGLIIFYKPIDVRLLLVNDKFLMIQNAYNISSDIFPMDIIHIFHSEVFSNDLDFVPSILNICNNFCFPTK